MRLRRDQDAFGQAVYRHFRGESAYEIVERDDGVISPAPGPALYLAPYEEWSSSERRALRHARGRVLDLGCNAGRHALWLQERGHDVVGIDVSPLAIKTARLRGVKRARVLPVTQVTRARLGEFDTILMLGNNFGLMANAARARRLLRRFAAMTSANARILAGSIEVYATKDLTHLRYQRRNRARGRMGGQIRLRIRFREFRSPWFDYLLVSKSELRGLARGTGWRVARLLPAKNDTMYAAVLEKER